MERENFSNPEMLDTQIEGLAQALQQHQQKRQNLANEPELRMAHDIRHAYQAEANEDERSLERVLARLVGNSAAARSKIVLFSQTNQQRERTPKMQNTLNSVPYGKAKAKNAWVRRAGLLVAVLCLALLVGGFLVVLNSANTKSAGQPTHGPITPVPAPTHGPITPVPAPTHGPITPVPAPTHGPITPVPAPTHGPTTPTPQAVSTPQK